MSCEQLHLSGLVCQSGSVGTAASAQDQKLSDLSARQTNLSRLVHRTSCGQLTCPHVVWRTRGNCSDLSAGPFRRRRSRGKKTAPPTSGFCLVVRVSSLYMCTTGLVYLLLVSGPLTVGVIIRVELCNPLKCVCLRVPGASTRIRLARTGSACFV